MRTYIDVIDKGVTVVNNTVGVGRHIIIKINKNFVKKDSPDGFQNRSVMTSLRQEVGRGSEVGLSIWNS